MDTISRVSSLLEPTRDLTLEASVSATALRKPTASSSQATLPQVKKLLESRHDREVLDGLKRLTAITQNPRARNQNGASQLLPTVLKNISSPNNHIRKLVYAILVEHAESDQDTALLSINSIQKALSASDPHIRALALRTISSLRVPVIAQIVALGIKRAVGDMSAIVRRTAALSIPKCWRLDSSLAPQLEVYLGQLLGDRQYTVAAAACIALDNSGLLANTEGRRTVVNLLHKHYRGLCRKLVDMDEWGQLAALKVLTIYARMAFPQRSKKVKKSTPRDHPNKERRLEEFYNEPPALGDDSEDTSVAADYEVIQTEDLDLTLLFKSAQPLLHSRNPAVVIAVNHLYISLDSYATTNEVAVSPNVHIQAAVPPLLSLLRSSSTPSILPIALQNIVQIALNFPSLFVASTRHFLIKSTDSPLDTAPLKLEVLCLIFPHAPIHTQSLILTELDNAAQRHTNTSSTLVQSAVAGIGRCAMASPPGSSTSRRCLKLLLNHVKSDASALDNVFSQTQAAPEALTQIRHLVQTDPQAHIATVIRLSKDLDTTNQSKARAAIVWLVGEYAGTDMSSATSGSEMSAGDGVKMGNIAVDVLRILSRNFASEQLEVKTQILLLAAKCYIHYLNSLPQPDKTDQEDPSTYNTVSGDDETKPVPLLYAYIHSLVRYDTSYTLRDTARLHRSLLPPPALSTFPSFSGGASSAANAANTQLATLLLLAPKPPPVSPSPALLRKDLELGTAALVIGSGSILNYEENELPDRVREGEEPDPRLRDEGGIEAPQRLSAPAGERLEASNTDSRPTPKLNERTLEDWLGEGEGEVSEETETESESEYESSEYETDEEE